MIEYWAAAYDFLELVLPQQLVVIVLIINMIGYIYRYVKHYTYGMPRHYYLINIFPLLILAQYYTGRIIETNLDYESVIHNGHILIRLAIIWAATLDIWGHAIIIRHHRRIDAWIPS